MILSDLYVTAACLVHEHRAEFACHAIYMVKRGKRRMSREFYRANDHESFALCHLFANQTHHNTTWNGVFGPRHSHKAREARVYALLLMAAIVSD
jgi:hypothetical protein